MREIHIRKLLERAEKSVHDATLLSNEKSYNTAISRSYYAAFYSAEAILISKEITTRSHKGVITMFGKHLVVPGEIEPKFGRILQQLFNLRQTSDYSIMEEYNQQDAEKAIALAVKFVERIKEELQ